jgi:hypothetical protein
VLVLSIAVLVLVIDRQSKNCWSPVETSDLPIRMPFLLSITLSQWLSVRRYQAVGKHFFQVSEEYRDDL